MFPDLPLPPPGLSSWPLAVTTPYEIVLAAYCHAMNVHEEQSTEPLRLEIARERLESEREMLVGMSYHGISLEWISLGATAMLELDFALQEAQVYAEGR